MISTATGPSLATYTFVVLRIALTSFGGGISGWMMRIVVQERRWMSETEFLSGLALCQVFPGVNVVNLAIWLGYRLHGGIGALVGALTMIIPPALVIIGIAAAFSGLSEFAGVRTALDGVGAAAIGLTGAMGLRAAWRSAAAPAPAIILLLTFAAVGILHWPLVPVVAVLAPVSIALATLGRGSPRAR